MWDAITELGFLKFLGLGAVFLIVGLDLIVQLLKILDKKLKEWEG